MGICPARLSDTMHKPAIIWLTAVVFLIGCGTRLTNSQEAEKQPLHLVRTIPLPNVIGRLDHMDVDVKGKRLFVAGLENGSLEVVDLQAGKWIGTIPGFKKSQGVLYVPELDKLFVASGDDGMLRVFRVHTLELLDSIHLEAGPNRVVYEPHSKLVYVGYGGKDAGKDHGEVGVIDASNDKAVGSIKVAAHPSELLLDKSGTTLFVFISIANQLQVIDTNKREVVSTWQVSGQRPGDAAFDESSSRLFIGTRTPPEMIAMDSISGREVAHLPTVEGMDGVYFDAKRKRIYVSGGRELPSGFVFVYQQKDADHYETVGKIPTRAGAGTSFWSPALDRYYVAAPANDKESAAILVYAPSESATTDALDFQLFKTKVEPIFLKQRAGHARCYGCHILPNRGFHLEPLSPGSTEWNDDQSQRNFQHVLQHVVPGDTSSSRLLIHPLAPEAGGDAFHSGGRQFASQNDPDWLVLAEWVRSVRTETASELSAPPKVLVYVTNSAGDTINVIDPASNKVVQVISGIELPHGIVFSPDGARVYVSNESESVLDVVDRQSGQILKKVSLSARPNNLAITKDGSKVLVGIRTEPGVIDVIDTASLTRVKSIPVDGGVHNVFVTQDGKYAVSGSIEKKSATVVDLSTEKAVWVVKFDRPVRPMAFETNSDGSTSRIFVQLSGFNGFAVVDFAKRAEVTRIKLPDKPSGFGMFEGRLGVPSHGIGTAPDGKSLWVNSTLANAVFKYSLPDFKLMGYATLPEVHPLGRPPTGSVPEWITFTPDSKVVYVSNSGAGSVSAIDAYTLKEIAVIPVGEVPKRINTLVLH